MKTLVCCRWIRWSLENNKCRDDLVCTYRKYAFYSTGCITIDPNNNESIWLGTGENVGGRHVGIGHGIYHSTDGGKTWKNKGLKESEHLSKIIVHPNDPNTVWVASRPTLEFWR